MKLPPINSNTVTDQAQICGLRQTQAIEEQRQLMKRPGLDPAGIGRGSRQRRRALMNDQVDAGIGPRVGRGDAPSRGVESLRRR
jgi:hypothetical protein